MFYSHRKSGQPGPITRIMCCTPEEYERLPVGCTGQRLACLWWLAQVPWVKGTASGWSCLRVASILKLLHLHTGL